MGIFFNPQHTHPDKLDMKSPPPPPGLAIILTAAIRGEYFGPRAASSVFLILVILLSVMVARMLKVKTCILTIFDIKNWQK